MRRLCTSGRPRLDPAAGSWQPVYVSCFPEELAFLGIESSPAFARAPEGNGCAGRFVRILKENLLWVRTFATVEEVRQALLEFKRTYHENWIIQRHGYKTPAQVRLEPSQALSLAA